MDEEIERAESRSTAQPQLSYRLDGSGVVSLAEMAEAGEDGGVHNFSIKSARNAGVRTFESSKWCVLERRGSDSGIGR
jgi:hypothetical protein